MQSDIDMVLYQIEFCTQTKKDKEQEIFNNMKQKEAIEKILLKAKSERNQANKLQTVPNEDEAYINAVTEKVVETNDMPEIGHDQE